MAMAIDSPALTDSAEQGATPSVMLVSAKRMIDLIGALLLFLIVAPAMIAIAIVSLAVDWGPIFYVHERIGRGGQPFGCIKFRTMRVDAENAFNECLQRNPKARQEWELRHKLKQDPRLTHVGQFLRRTSLDELPQLVNVLRGDMSLVGPRPVILGELQKHYRGAAAVAYTSVRPGMTGLWQVSGRSNADYKQRVLLDCEYVKALSLRTDFLLLAKTISVVAKCEGAY